MVALAEPTAEEYAAARAGIFFIEYLRYVHGWEVRPHQKRWAGALQALGDGVLRHPEAPQCDICIAEELRWISISGEDYATGFRACKNCRKTTFLAIPGYPGCGKSDTLIEWCAWMIGRDTYEGKIPQLGWSSYSEDVAAIRSVAIRDTIAFNKRYQLVFPMAVPMKGKGWGETEWFLLRDDPGKKDPTMRATGFGGSMGSYRVTTAFVIDDPHDPKLVKTPGQRDDTWRTWTTTLKTRIAQGVTPVVATSNRWAEDDFIGRIQSEEKGWVVLRTPALDENEETVWAPEILPNGTPVGVSTETLNTLREDNRIAFLTQYMVLPPSAEGEVFRYFLYMKKPAPDEIVRISQFWDTATSINTKSDYTSMTEFQKTRNGPTCLAKVINVRLSPSEVVDLMEREYERAVDICRNTLVLIEDAHAGSTFSAFLRSKTGINVRLHKIGGMGKGSKVTGPRDLMTRASAIIKHIDEGDIRLPYGAQQDIGRASGIWEPWGEAFLNQIMGFPNSDHDDMVASFIGNAEFNYPHRGTSFQKVNVTMTGWGY